MFWTQCYNVTMLHGLASSTSTEPTPLALCVGMLLTEGWAVGWQTMP